MLDPKNLPGSLLGEKIDSVHLRHPIVLVGPFVAFGLALILPFLAFAIPNVRALLPAEPIFQTIAILGASAYLLFILLFLFQQFMEYWLDVWILTNERIINIEQNGLFSRTSSELRLEKVQDVTSETKGFLESMLDFGTVYVQTAGETKRFAFEDVPHPDRVAKRIMELAEGSDPSPLSPLP